MLFSVKLRFTVVLYVLFLQCFIIFGNNKQIDKKDAKQFFIGNILTKKIRQDHFHKYFILKYSDILCNTVRDLVLDPTTVIQFVV